MKMLPWLREKLILRRQRWLRSRNEETTKQNESQDDDARSQEAASTAASSVSSELLYLKIISPRHCTIITLQVSYFDSGLQMKEKLLKKLLEHAPPQQSPTRLCPNDIHLVRSCTKQHFRDFDSVLSGNVKNMEEFVAIIRRSDNSMNRLLNVQNQHGPTEKEILNRTKNIPVVRSGVTSTLNMTLDSAFLQGDLQHDLRKILSEIAKYSAYILGSLPYAEKLIRYYRQKILYSLNNQKDIIKILRDMGFSHSNVIRALRIHNNYTLALDWLVENVGREEDEDARGAEEEHGDETLAAAEEEEEEEGVEDGQDENEGDRGGQSKNSNMELSSDVEENFSDTYKKFYTRPFSSTNSIFYSKHKAISIKERVEGLLEIVRYYSEKNEEPSTKADTINSLINMGFAMDEIERALQVTNNHQTAACEWLLEHSSNPQNSNALRESIFVESHILKILLSTPQIQFSLSSPKFFIAFVSLLENYSSLNIFFNDLESQSLLQFILRTYHEEKIFYHTFEKLSSVTPVVAPSSSSSSV